MGFPLYALYAVINGREPGKCFNGLLTPWVLRGAGVNPTFVRW